MTEHLPPHEQRAVESLGWTTSAQTGQVVVPIWWLTSSQELLTETLLAMFSLVVEGGGFLTLEDTGLRCVVNGALVWVARVDSCKVTVHPTDREIGSVFAGQTDGLQGEAPGKTWALPWWCLSVLTFPNLFGSHVLICPAELVYLKLVALQRFILSLSLSVWPVLT